MAALASTRVFALPELLEQILLAITFTHSKAVDQARENIKQLFVLQRTNTIFRDTIRRSIMLQQAMFLKEADHEQWGGHIVNFLMQDGSPLQLVRFEVCSTYFRRDDESLASFCDVLIYDMAKSANASFDYHKASWRSMRLLSTSSPLHVHLTVRANRWNDKKNDRYGTGWWEFDGDCTLGQFIEKIMVKAEPARRH